MLELGLAFLDRSLRLKRQILSSNLTHWVAYLLTYLLAWLVGLEIVSQLAAIDIRKSPVIELHWAGCVTMRPSHSRTPVANGKLCGSFGLHSSNIGFPSLAALLRPLFFINLSLEFVSIGDVECGIICSGALLGPPRCGRRQDTLAQCFVSLPSPMPPPSPPGSHCPHTSRAAPTTVLKCYPGPVHYHFMTNLQNEIKRTRRAVSCFSVCIM